MGKAKQKVDDLEVDDAEHRFNEFAYILHQVDARCIASFLKEERKPKSAGSKSSDLSTSQH